MNHRILPLCDMGSLRPLGSRRTRVNVSFSLFVLKEKKKKCKHIVELTLTVRYVELSRTIYNSMQIKHVLQLVTLWATWNRWVLAILLKNRYFFGLWKMSKIKLPKTGQNSGLFPDVFFSLFLSFFRFGKLLICVTLFVGVSIIAK